MPTVLILLALLGTSFAAPMDTVTYENHKLIKVLPASSDDVQILKGLENDMNFQFWTCASAASKPVDVMVSPKSLPRFQALLNETGMLHRVVIENVQSLIDAEKRLTRDGQGFGWDRYHPLDEIYEWMESLAEKYPDQVQVIDMGVSYEKRAIKGVKLSNGMDKPGIFIEGGMHAREWISHATVTYLLDQFLTSQDPDIRQLAENYDWYFVPAINPDGYVFTHTSNRLWRKTRSGSGFCKGADPNRNWGYKWMDGGASSFPCAENYAGKSAFSEPEAKSMSEYLLTLKDKLFAYISFHSYSQLLMFPYGHTTQHLDNYDEEKTMASMATKALAQRYGTEYATGNIAETIYIASGSSMDWVKATLKLPVTYTYELRDTGRHGFLLPASEIIPNGEEVMDSLVAMFKEATKFGYPYKPAE